MNIGFPQLESLVVRRGLCTGCGSCVGICPSAALSMSRVYGEPMPVCTGVCSSCGLCSRICPGNDVPLLELERHCFGRNRKPALADLGVYRNSYNGYARDDFIRKKGASGGVVTALLVHALETGIIDCAIVAGFNTEKPWLTEAKIAASREEIVDAAQSKYAVVPVNMRIREAVKRGYRRIALVGLPCHIHAVRKMQYYGIPRDISVKIKLTIGLFCASQFYFEGTRHILVEWCGIDKMEEIARLEYRGGDWPGHFVVQLRNGETVTVDRHRYVYHMLMPHYKRDRCEMCIDWSSELADIAVGDYWAPQRTGPDYYGTSALLVRSSAGEEVVKSAVEEKVVYLEDLDPDKLCSSVGFEMKKHGAAYRLAQRQQFGWPTPNYHMQVDYTPFFRDFHMAPEKKES
ncbi:Coenzyme F420 hydrogenase/dehydrogenase, beta subunit C-terminal domain [Calderihabitans maritimus]|uniref:Coenzyme F420 hydrogenase subunit beta n=1 Tax=Calderihabitans maritimus TaxID=1246530 RepID=A0A1Z5HTS2_9FIRM|nr:Coenzyme F420 hydrogenase/dehydrogenase, beta subunit C-terminal domain [Calderihabitans maritimus]GAW92818.1 coenzyme F420 hydrogenase subunit beta [Calderihabitans maritimus]